MKRKFISILLILSLLAGNLYAVEMIEVSVDTIEIKSTKEGNTGITWGDSIAFTEGLESSNYVNLTEGIAPSMLSVSTLKRTGAVSATLRALITDNKARILANPKLATESGSQATFLVGGEIPVPVVSPQGTSIEWKTYGINLQIKPAVVNKDQVSAMIQVSVSDLDYANSVKLEGYDVPALLNRSATSKVTVDDGGTAVIAGLKQARKETTESRVPILGSIPLLGWFFRGKTDRDVDTSMVIFVTFKILKG